MTNLITNSRLFGSFLRLAVGVLFKLPLAGYLKASASVPPAVFQRCTFQVLFKGRAVRVLAAAYLRES